MKRIFTVFFLGLNLVICQDDFGNDNAGSEYLNVFKNIPTLFENLLETLQQKPEILEKNDVDLFKVDEDDLTDDRDDVTRFERSASEKKAHSNKGITPEVVEKNEIALFEADGSDEGAVNGDVTRFERSTVEKENHRKVEDKGMDLDQSTDDRKRMGIGGKNGEEKNKIINARYGRSPGENELKTTSTDEDGNKNDGNTESVEDADDMFWPLDAECDKVLSLTSEEIAEQALKVEEKLDQHNSRK